MQQFQFVRFAGAKGLLDDRRVFFLFVVLQQNSFAPFPLIPGMPSSSIGPQTNRQRIAHDDNECNFGPKGIGQNGATDIPIDGRWYKELVQEQHEFATKEIVRLFGNFYFSGMNGQKAATTATAAAAAAAPSSTRAFQGR